MYVPFPLVWGLNPTPVASFLTVTVAFGMTAPFGSLTIPDIEVVVLRTTVIIVHAAVGYDVDPRSLFESLRCNRD